MAAEHEHHKPFEDLAVRHVMGALSPSESSTFRSHLLDCPDCRARVGELRSIASELADVEREERRERIAKRVEIKERTEAEEEVPPPVVVETPRGARILVIGGLVLLIVIAVWNFVLRGQNESLQATLVAEQQAAAVVNFGTPWEAEVTSGGVDGVARIERGSLAVMVRGTDDDATYMVHLYDETGAVLSSERVVSVDDRVRYLAVSAPAAATTVEVVLDRSSGETVVFRAVSP